MYKYPVAKPVRNDLAKELVIKTIDDGWISSQAPVVSQFEEEWATYNGMKHGIACSSGTTALVVALKSLNLEEGAEVIVPNFTMIATAWAVEMAGYTPVFVDSGHDLNIYVPKIEDAITKKTKAIIPVHIYGRQCDMDAIIKIAYEYNLYVIEDSAEAHGIKPRGDIACYSLFANKIINSGEGGICLTNNKHLMEQMKHLRGMAFDLDHTFLHKKYGFNFRMNALTAAYALGEVRKIDEYLEKRQWICREYDKYLKHLTIPRKISDVLWMYDIVVDNRDELIEKLKENGIETRVGFKTMTQQPMYRNIMDYSQIGRYYSGKTLYLPTYLDLTADDIKFISKTVLDLIQ